METAGEVLCITALQQKGFAKDVLDRIIVIEFGGDASAFDAFSPAGYVIRGRYIPLSKVGPEYR